MFGALDVGRVPAFRARHMCAVLQLCLDALQHSWH